MNRENSSSMIRILAGGYLLYLAYQMIVSLRAGEVDNKWLIISATVLFVIAGAGILYYGIRGMINQSKMSDEEQADENLNEELEMEEEMYDEYVEPGLTQGKMKSIEQELEKLKEEDAKAEAEEKNAGKMAEKDIENSKE